MPPTVIALHLRMRVTLYFNSFLPKMNHFIIIIIYGPKCSLKSQFGQDFLPSLLETSLMSLI